MGLSEDLRELLEAESLDLVKAATRLGSLEGVPVEERAVEEELDRLADEVRPRLQDLPPDRPALETLNHFLFEEQGFQGNREDYYDPKNSLLQEVLQRRVGIPILLSLLYLEVGRRCGLPLAGIGFPAHFLVRLDAPKGATYIDPFHKGRLLSPEDLPAFLEELSEGQLVLDPTFLTPVTEGQFLSRMLANLKAIYLRSEEFPKLLEVLDALLLLNPDSPVEHRDRGLLHFELGNFSQARVDLTRYLDLDPSAGDAEVVREHLREIESQLAMYR